MPIVDCFAFIHTTTPPPNVGSMTSANKKGKELILYLEIHFCIDIKAQREWCLCNCSMILLFVILYIERTDFILNKFSFKILLAIFIDVCCLSHYISSRSCFIYKTSIMILFPRTGPVHLYNTFTH